MADTTRPTDNRFSWSRGPSDAVYTHTRASAAHPQQHLVPPGVGRAEGYQRHLDTSNGKES